MVITKLNPTKMLNISKTYEVTHTQMHSCAHFHHCSDICKNLLSGSVEDFIQWFQGRSVMATAGRAVMSASMGVSYHLSCHRYCPSAQLFLLSN